MAAVSFAVAMLVDDDDHVDVVGRLEAAKSFSFSPLQQLGEEKY